MRGFTLVELLVAITVLTLIMLGVSQMMNSTVTITLGGFKHMDADTQSRLVLDRIAFDVSKMVKRTDVDYYFNNSTSAPNNGYGSDMMLFFSEATGYYPDPTTTDQSTVSLVGYRMNSSYQLERLSKGLVWNGVAPVSQNYPMVFLPQTIIGTWGANNNLTKSPGGDADYQVIGDQVFCMKLSYLIQKDASTLQLTDTPNTTSITAGSTGYFDPTRVQAIIVTIAVLDSNSQKLLPNASTQLQAAATKLDGVLPTPPATTPLAKLPLNLWQTKLSTEMGSGGYLGLGKTVASQVRFYQRYCYLNQVLQQ